MVKGLDLFRTQFQVFTDSYVLIGGAACDLNMEEKGLEFRATKDLDIILCIEGLTREFAEAIWQFIREGRYQAAMRSDGQRCFYRFHKPESSDYPQMLEFFSRVPESLDIPEDIHLIPVPMANDISSLSAILLDDIYYNWVRSSAKRIQDVIVADAEHLIPLKVHAWLDLSARRDKGERIDSKQVRKHYNDVLRLSQIIEPESSLDPLPERVQIDMRRFLDHLHETGMPDNVPGVESSLKEIVDLLRQVYDQ